MLTVPLQCKKRNWQTNLIFPAAVASVWRNLWLWGLCELLGKSWDGFRFLKIWSCCFKNPSVSAYFAPLEFCPGVPWKGLQNIDPENDPNMTPGSVPSGPTINTNIHDVNRYLLRDRNGGINRGKDTNQSISLTHQYTLLTPLHHSPQYYVLVLMHTWHYLFLFFFSLSLVTPLLPLRPYSHFPNSSTSEWFSASNQQWLASQSLL